MQLRPYQTEALKAIIASDSLRQLVVLPTGTGKTVLFSELARVRNQQGRTLILVHRDELVRQARAKCHENGLKDIGIIQAENNDISANVCIASVQSLCRPQRMAQYLSYGQCKTLIIDEAHHSVAPTYMAVIENCLDSKGLLLGVTATPDRKDRGAGRWHTGTRSLGKVYDTLTYYRPIDDMIAEGWLADIVPATVTVNLGLEKKAGDWSDSELENKFTKQVGQDIAIAWQNAMTNHGNRPTIVFVPTVGTAQLVADQFSAQGITTEWVSGETPTEDRQLIYKRLRNGDTQVLVNCMVLTEGFDEPSIGCVVVARPTKSRALFTQMIGRGLRLFPGKTDCLVMSVIDHSLNLSPITLQHIFDDPAWTDNKKLSERKKEIAEKEATEEEAKVKAIEFVQAFKKRSTAKMIWQTHLGMWRLAVPGQGIITLTEDGKTEDDVTLWQIIWPSGFMSEPQRIEGAVATAEQWVTSVAGSNVLNSEAGWNQKPPTPNQLTFAKRLGIKDAPNMTRGQVAQAIAEKQTEPATDKQISYARYLGWTGDPRTTSKREMAKWIAQNAPARKVSTK